MRTLVREGHYCTRYGIHGHNARSCTSLVVDAEAQKIKVNMVIHLHHLLILFL